MRYHLKLMFCVTAFFVVLGIVGCKPAVVKVDEDKVYVNVGSKQAVSKFDKFIVYRQKEPIFDLDKGKQIGFVEENLGEIVIVDVKEDYSIAEIANDVGKKEIMSGDLIRKKEW